MKAVRFYAQNDIRVEDIDIPKPDPGGLLVKVQACAICGTDLKMFLSGNPRVKPPQTIGHEFVGEIVELGAGVTGYALGERITMATSISCNICPNCRAGFTNRCENLTPVSYDYPGAFAEYIAIPPAGVTGGNVIRVPDTLNEIAALAEPISCAVNAQQLANVKLGDTVVIVGFGPLGAIHAQLAKARGAAKVFVTQRSKQRLQYARDFNIDEIIDVKSADPVQRVMQLTNGVGADVVIVCAPAAPAQEQAFAMARKGGMINLFASLPKNASELKIDSRLIHYRELFVSGGSDSTPYQVELAVKLLATGAIRPETITHRLPISQFMEGLRLMKNAECLKVLVIPE